MFARIAFIAWTAPLALLLAGCQSPNPYTATSMPLPPAPPQADSTFDSSAYPAAPRDFAAYRTWRWHADRPPEGAAGISGEELQQALSGALDQRGLRPAQAGNQADLRVDAQVRIERRLRQEREYFDSHGGYYGGRHYSGAGYGLGASAPLIRTYEEEVVVVSIELLDPTDGQPLWRGYAETRAADSPAERAKALRAALEKALANYPPR